ncbi:hypothetical protein Q8A73_000805 [Channa argus]|nr:hypothetical protein Q8A73_000805 [Channa argus]
MTRRLLISESLRRFNEQPPGSSRPPPPRYSDSPLSSTPKRNPVPPADRFQLRYTKMELRGRGGGDDEGRQRFIAVFEDRKWHSRPSYVNKNATWRGTYSLGVHWAKLAVVYQGQNTAFYQYDSVLVVTNPQGISDAGVFIYN